MVLSDIFRNVIDGDWNITDDKAQQNRTHGITRVATDIGYSDFVATFSFCLTDAMEDKGGEAKFIFADADNPGITSENYRIDFIYAASICRITAGNMQFMSNLMLIRNHSYKVRVCVKDNLLSIIINGMLIFERFNIGRRSDGKIGFGTYQAAVIFSEVSIEPYIEKECFVIMQFDEKRNIIYDLVIEPVLKSHPAYIFKYTRADKAMTTGKISEEIKEWTKNADAIVADITENNRNVFYELGLAHAFKRKAVLLIEKREGIPLDIPFDIHDFRCHQYEFSSAGFDDLKHRLTEILEHMLEESST
jgi:hypothetical protein